ncbi:MAG TPA: hypothetical protein VGD55_12270, partial [Acidothermaceae bacterium]
NEALISGAGSRRAQARGVVGGILAGVGGSAGIAALSSSDNRSTLVVIMLLGMVIGVALVVAAFSQRS